MSCSHPASIIGPVFVRDRRFKVVFGLSLREPWILHDRHARQPKVRPARGRTASVVAIHPATALFKALNACRPRPLQVVKVAVSIIPSAPEIVIYTAALKSSAGPVRLTTRYLERDWRTSVFCSSSAFVVERGAVHRQPGLGQLLALQGGAVANEMVVSGHDRGDGFKERSTTVISMSRKTRCVFFFFTRQAEPYCERLRQTT